MFDFQYVHKFETQSIKTDQPMVFFATPGMLHGGLSLQTFKEWAPDPKNAIIIPGYCMPGTVGNKVLSGDKVIQIDNKDVAVNMQVYNMSFSAHADSKGIMELLTHLEPKNVFLVHGEKQKMKVLAENVRQKIGVPCYYPPNHSVTVIETDPKIDIAISTSLISEMNQNFQKNSEILNKPNCDVQLKNCILKMKNEQMHLQTVEEFENEESLQEIDMRFEIDMGCEMDPELFKQFDPKFLIMQQGKVTGLRYSALEESIADEIYSVFNQD